MKWRFGRLPRPDWASNGGEASFRERESVAARGGGPSLPIKYNEPDTILGVSGPYSNLGD
jgi:hypothetical protein